MGPHRQQFHSDPGKQSGDRQSLLYGAQRRRASSSCQSNRRHPGFSLRLISSALIRNSDRTNVYMSIRKSMTVRTYIHSPLKRAETTALLDSGATENFMNLAYAKWLKLPIKALRYPRPLFNVDGSTNKQGDLKFYSDLIVRTGTTKKNMRFFLSDLGNHQLILGYPWFAAYQPKVDWARGWIDVSQLPIVVSTPDAPKIHPVSRPSLVLKARVEDDQKMYVARISFPPDRAIKEED